MSVEPQLWHFMAGIFWPVKSRGRAASHSTERTVGRGGEGRAVGVIREIYNVSTGLDNDAVSLVLLWQSDQRLAVNELLEVTGGSLSHVR